MPPIFRLAVLVIAAILSPASCLPHPDHYDSRSLHSPRAAAPFKLPGWEIAVIIFGLILGLILFGVIGGACETLICLSFKRPIRKEAEPTPEGLEFGCQGPPRTMPEIRVIVDKETGDQASAHRAESSHSRSTSNSSAVTSSSGISSTSTNTSRYSWQDEKGITTELYIDGALPDAGQETVSQIQYQGYQVQGAMRGYEGVHYQDPAVGLASNPPFVLHNEEDDSDYEDVVSSPGDETETRPGCAVAMSTDDVVSPLTPVAQDRPWPRHVVSREQAKRYFADVDPEERYVIDECCHDQIIELKC